MDKRKGNSVKADADDAREAVAVAAAELTITAMPADPMVDEPGAPAQGYTRVLLVDANRQNDTATDIKSIEFGRRINVAGAWYDHCDDAADGTWRFEPVR